jgi:hypothetical protein
MIELQIIKQPDGRWCVYEAWRSGIAARDLERHQVARVMADLARKEAERHFREEVDGGRKSHCKERLSWNEAVYYDSNRKKSK